MKRSLLVLAVLAVAGLGFQTAPASLTTEAVSFQVTNPLVPGETYTVAGSLTRPTGCTGNVILAQHGLSYGKWAWDFPLQPATYSTAAALAARGYSVLAIDRLGYGESDHPNGYTLTVESYAAITKQIIDQLKAGTYTAASPSAFANVGLMGHSAGAEVTELAAGLYPDDVAVVIPGGYQHTVDGVSSEWLIREWITGDVVRAFQDDYAEFEQGVRSEDFYNLDYADAAIVAKDNELAHLTPSGEIFTISFQPSRFVMGSITAPVLLVLAADDVLFPASNGPAELAMFSGTADKTLHVVPNAGHTYLLHPNAPDTNDVVADWLDARQAHLPKCA